MPIRPELTEDDLAEIRARHARGTGLQSLARRFGVTPHCVDAIVRGRPWQHLAQKPPPQPDLFEAKKGAR